MVAAVSPRVRRALTLMFLAVVVIGATSAYYLRPWATLKSAAAVAQPVRPFPVVRAGDMVFYSFVNLALGWAVETPQPAPDSSSGNFAVYKTGDAGKHWRKQLSGHTPVVIQTVTSFKFVDPYHGFVVAGDPLALYRTGDGGDHWTRLHFPTPDGVGFQFTDSSHLWLIARPQIAIAPYHVFASSDGGDSWTERPDIRTDLYFYPIFRDGSVGWSGASYETSPYVWVTADGGLTWERRDLPTDPDTPQQGNTWLRLLPGTGVVAYVSSSGKGIQLNQTLNYTSLDAGRSWRAITRASTVGDLGNYEFQDSTHWWSIQDRALYKTADAGLTWTPGGVTPAGLSLLRVFDAKHAWAELDEGYGIELVSTSDGGLHWTRANVPIGK